VVDVVAGRIVPDTTVVVTGDTITSVTQHGIPPDSARVIDGRGKFLIPGLWDMHAHIEGNERAWLPLYIANGVTGIRDMGADLDFILEVREATASGRTLGPRIVAAGPILDDAPADWPFRIRVRNPDEGRAAVRLLKRRGVDLIKVHNYTPRDVHDELALMVSGGMTPLAALQTATVNPARYLGRDATLGTIAPGRAADLVLLDANPIEDIANVRRLYGVITAGRFFDRGALDRLLAQAKAAAQQ
jgi:imidazolonepropionase-like amidohydrolase